MSYLVLSRKYRPGCFDEVVGQEHITKTLSNAIREGRIAHAYLFSGPRGTGKTSVARILAKCLNCRKGSSPRPCGQCSSCLEISEGRSLDVIEIDGASNRGIDEIRDLRERVKFVPINSRFKVYIIDEVHMLTEPAFNALLKTLEEPPLHAIFILATTESHRIPPTILSRTQRFDFRRIPPSLIMESLVKITEQEGFQAERRALSLIARCAEGSLRDGQSILDQVIAYSGEKISLEDVFEVLGMIKQEEIKRLARAIANGEVETGLDLIEEFIDQGIDLFQLAFDLTEYFRSLLMVISFGRDSRALVDLSPEEIDDLKKEADGFKATDLIGIIEELIKLNQEMKDSLRPRLLWEITLIKLAKRRRIPQLEEIHKETTPLDIEEVRLAWPRVIKGLKEEKPSLGSCLEQGELVEIQNGIVIVGFRQDSVFQRETCEKQDAQVLIRNRMREVLGQDLEIKTVLLKQKEDNSKEEMEPIVKKALEIFGGKIVKGGVLENGQRFK